MFDTTCGSGLEADASVNYSYDTLYRLKQAQQVDSAWVIACQHAGHKFESSDVAMTSANTIAGWATR